MAGGEGGLWSDQGGPWIPQPSHTEWASSTGFIRWDNLLDGLFSTKALLLQRTNLKPTAVVLTMYQPIALITLLTDRWARVSNTFIKKW